LAGLAPKGSLVAAQSIERAIIEIGEAQKAASDLGVSAMGRSGGAVQFLLTIVLPWRLVIRSTIVPFWVRPITGLSITEPSDGIENAIMGLRLSSSGLSDLSQDVTLDLEKTGFDGGGTAQSPQ
jgi:hypothetical protein